MHREVRCTRVRYAEVRKEIHFKKRLGGGSKRGGGSSRKKGLAGGGFFAGASNQISLMKWGKMIRPAGQEKICLSCGF